MSLPKPLEHAKRIQLFSVKFVGVSDFCLKALSEKGIYSKQARANT